MRLAAIVAVPIVLAAPAHADDDTDFANQLHNYGFYGPTRLQRLAGQDRVRSTA
jgi:hypothetical protein